mmetsp:Transcript_107213/g.300188  ORF Transcript_107213/g.300188 Transcript_107213/m.300188 type:complete len:342 (+) Transcript_107213:64-1089(+)
MRAEAFLRHEGSKHGDDPRLAFTSADLCHDGLVHSLVAVLRCAHEEREKDHCDHLRMVRMQVYFQLLPHVLQLRDDELQHDLPVVGPEVDEVEAVHPRDGLRHRGALLAPEDRLTHVDGVRHQVHATRLCDRAPQHLLRSNEKALEVVLLEAPVRAAMVSDHELLESGRQVLLVMVLQGQQDRVDVDDQVKPSDGVRLQDLVNDAVQVAQHLRRRIGRQALAHAVQAHAASAQLLQCEDGALPQAVAILDEVAGVKQCRRAPDHLREALPCQDILQGVPNLVDALLQDLLLRQAQQHRHDADEIPEAAVKAVDLLAVQVPAQETPELRLEDAAATEDDLAR